MVLLIKHILNIDDEYAFLQTMSEDEKTFLWLYF